MADNNFQGELGKLVAVDLDYTFDRPIGMEDVEDCARAIREGFVAIYDRAGYKAEILLANGPVATVKGNKLTFVVHLHQSIAELFLKVLRDSKTKTAS